MMASRLIKVFYLISFFGILFLAWNLYHLIVRPEMAVLTRMLVVGSFTVFTVMAAQRMAKTSEGKSGRRKINLLIVILLLLLLLSVHIYNFDKKIKFNLRSDFGSPGIYTMDLDVKHPDIYYLTGKIDSDFPLQVSLTNQDNNLISMISQSVFKDERIFLKKGKYKITLELTSNEIRPADLVTVELCLK